MFSADNAHYYIENIFIHAINEAQNNQHTHNTLSLSLYHLCIDYVAKHALSYENQLRYLPVHARISIYRRCIGDGTVAEYLKIQPLFFGIPMSSLKALQCAFKINPQKASQKISETNLEIEILKDILPNLSIDCSEENVFIEQKIPAFSNDQIYEACYIHKALDLSNQISAIERLIDTTTEQKTTKHTHTYFTLASYLDKIDFLVNISKQKYFDSKKDTVFCKEARTLKITYIFLEAQIARLANEASKRLNKSNLFKHPPQAFEIGMLHSQIDERTEYAKCEQFFLAPMQNRTDQVPADLLYTH